MKVLKALIKPHSVHPLPLHRLSAGGGIEPLTKFSKRGDLAGFQFLEGGLLGKRV